MFEITYVDNTKEIMNERNISRIKFQEEWIWVVSEKQFCK